MYDAAVIGGGVVGAAVALALARRGAHTILLEAEPELALQASGTNSGIPFRDEAEAVALANDTIYGLSGSVWTRDGAKALRVARAVETAVLSINSNTSVRVATPFGGFKQSGYGRELGPHALDDYTDLKTVYYATT
jgi:choline dehydrogenase-like flavoprotein